MHPQMKAVVSSNVAGYLYLASKATLVIAFLNGGVYAYEDVNASVARQIDQVSSVGQWLNREIKGRHACQRLDDAALDGLLDGLTPLPDHRRTLSPLERAQLAGLLERYPFLRAAF